jgi:hypothetical protein
MALRKRDPDDARLGKAERKTHAALFRFPPPQDLAWGDVIALLGRLAEIQEGRKGSFKVTRHGVMTTLKAPRLRTALTADELSEVRLFLERSEEGVSTAVVAEGTRVLVAIGAGGARLFRLEGHAGPPRHLTPFEANGYPAYLRAGAAPGGAPQPVRVSFTKDLARALRGAEQVLLVADGPDGDAALEALRGELRSAHPAVYRSLVGPLVSRGKTSEEKLLALAREFYAAR